MTGAPRLLAGPLVRCCFLLYRGAVLLLGLSILLAVKSGFAVRFTPAAERAPQRLGYPVPQGIDIDAPSRQK